MPIRPFRAAIFGALLLIVACMGIWLSPYPLQDLPRILRVEGIPMIGGYLAVWLLILAVHEAGHLIGGWVVGNKFFWFRIGPVVLYRKLGRFGIKQEWKVPLTSSSIWPMRLEGLRRNVVIMLLGGPLASILFGALAVAILQPYVRGAEMVQPAAWLVLPLSLLLGIYTLIPYCPFRMPTDGYAIRRFFVDRSNTERQYAAAILREAYDYGVDPCEWDPAMVHLMASRLDETIDFLSSAYLAFVWATHRREIDRKST